MRHDGQPDLLGNLERDIERRNAGRAAGVASDPHLDADDQVAVRVDDAYALTGIDEPQIGGLADHHNLCAPEGKTGSLVARIRRIDDPAASEKEIRHAPAPALPQQTYTRAMSGESRRCARRGLALPPKVPRWIAVSPKTAIAPRLAAGSAARLILAPQGSQLNIL